MSWNICWIYFVFLAINSFSAQKFLQNIREDYCETYCKDLCNTNISDKTCHQNGSAVISNDYTLHLKNGTLTLNWTNSDIKEWNIFPISNETNVKLELLTVVYDSIHRPAVYYLTHLGVQEVKTYHLSGAHIEIYEKHLNCLNGSKSLEISTDMLNDKSIDYIQLSSLNHVEEIGIVSPDGTYPLIWINDDTFVGTPNLKLLRFSSIDIRNLTAKVFNSMRNLHTLRFSRVLVEDLQFLRSETLHKSLVTVTLEVNLMVDMKYFKDYTKLEYIYVNDKYKPYSNLAATVCTIHPLHCTYFTGIKCPDNFICYYDTLHRNLVMSGTHIKISAIPPLPIAITGDTTLYLDSNDIEELPKNTLSGYNDIKTLSVSNNRITSLAIDRLPKNLLRLNIKNNRIKRLDKDVIEYLSKMYYFQQAGNRWSVSCDEKRMLDFLHNVSFNPIEPVFFHHLNASCPNGCNCCFNRSTDHFMIDCRHADKHFYPYLPYSIPYNAILQLDGNQITSIEDSLGHASLRELYLFDNNIEELPFHLIPENITHLDLRKNMLEALDDQVVDFLKDREVQLSGNPWTCDCRAKFFLSFLRQREPLEYTAALDRCNMVSSGSCPEACICCLDNSTLPSFIIDCRFKELTEISPLPTPISGQSTLHFEGNYLEALHSSSLRGYANVGHLYLANNRLTAIDQLPENITTLDIRNNSISVLNRQLRDFLDKRIAASPQLKLFLSGNPWICTCEHKDFLHFVKSRSPDIEDLTDLYCGGTATRLIETNESDLCPSGTVHFVTLTISFMLIILTINIMIHFKQPLLIWLYEHNVCLSIAARRECDKQKKFDAFLSFTHKDEELIEEFVERLESGSNKFRLCFYLRDWLVGESIPECISQSVKDSKRIIILMTNNFLKSTWGRLEFRLALHATSQDRCKRLIVVLYPEVENFDDLDSELRTYMVMNTYLKRDDPNFWNKLIYSMPHVNVRPQPDPEAIELSALGNRNA